MAFKRKADLRTASALYRYGFAIAMIAIATGVRSALDPLYGTRSPYSLFLIAALIVAWAAGTGPGALVVLFGGLLGTLVYSEHSITSFRGGDVVTVVNYFLVALIGVFITASERRSIQAREDALHLAEARRQALEGEQTAKMEALEQAYAAQKASDQTRRDLARVLAGVSDGLILLDRDLHVLEVNDAAEAVSDKSREEALGRKFEEVWPDAHELSKRYRAVLRENRPARFDFQNPTGEWYDISAYPSQDGLAVFFQDVSERFIAESRLRASEDRYRTLTNTLPSIVWSAMPDGSLEAYNDRWYEYTGVEAENKPEWGWERIHPEDRSRFWTEWERARMTGEPFEAEYRLASEAGDYRWFSGRALPSRNESGEIVRWVGVTTDIQDRKAMGDMLEHLVKARTKELAESNAELERFCYSVSHDLRAPLRAIMSASMIVLEDFGETLPAEAQHELKRQARAARQMGELIDDLLELSRIGRTEVDRKPLELDAMARTLWAEHRFPGNLEIPEPLSASGDPRLLRLLLQNLLENTVKYAKPGPSRMCSSRTATAFFASAIKGSALIPSTPKRSSNLSNVFIEIRKSLAPESA